MRNYKWFFVLALMLAVFAFQTPKVLAVDDFGTALAQLKTAINTLINNNVSTQESGNFGYYVPVWERQQVLGVTVTACPVSGQMWLCSDGSYPAVNNNEMTCANGGNPSCQNSSSGGTYTPPPSDSPTGTCNPPAVGCGAGLTWNQTNCSCQGDASQPNNSGTFFCYSLNRQATATECDAADKAKTTQPTQPTQPPMSCPTPPANCPKWVVSTSGSGCGWCDYNSQPQQPTMTCPAGQQPECPSGAPSMINGTPTCPKTGETWTCQAPKMNNCPFFNYCNGKVVEKNGCKYCEPNNQQPREMMPDYTQDDDFSEDNFNQQPMVNWSDVARQATQMRSETARILKQLKTNETLTKILSTLDGYLKDIKAAKTNEAKKALDEKYSERDPYSELNDLRDEMNNIRMMADYLKEEKRITADYSRVAKSMAKLKPIKYVKVDVAELKGIIDAQGKAMQEAKTLAASNDAEGAKDILMSIYDDGSPGDIYCVLQTAGDFDKSLASVKNATIRNSLLEIVNDIFVDATSDPRGTCQFINNGNLRMTIMNLIGNAKNTTKANTSFNNKLKDLQKKIDVFNSSSDETSEDNF